MLIQSYNACSWSMLKSDNQELRQVLLDSENIRHDILWWIILGTSSNTKGLRSKCVHILKQLFPM